MSGAGDRWETTSHYSSADGKVLLRAHYWAADGAYSTCTFNEMAWSEAQGWVNQQRSRRRR